LIIILSDVHGNLPALKAVVAEIEQYDVEKIIVAGDLIGGPQPNEVIDLLKSLKGIMIVGNMDIALLRLAKGEAPKEWYSIKQFGLLRWTLEQIRPDVLGFLRTLHDQRVFQFKDALAIRIVHGSPRSPYESIFPDRDPSILRAAIEQTKENVLICGHTHVPWKKKLHGKLVINPGAVCSPLNKKPGAQYALMDVVNSELKVDHRSASYDISQNRKDFIESGLLEAGTGIARAFLRSCETGTDYAKKFIEHAYQLANEAGHQNIEYIPDGIWDEAIDTFSWEQSS
jgi:putative phosphoesterase